MINLPLQLPSKYVLRQALPFDMWSILFFVVLARLDPNQLRWQQFWVLEHDSRLVAFGQLRNFECAQELGTLFTKPNCRNQGLGTIIIQHLISQATQPLYLKCVERQLVKFYTKRGFLPVEFEDLPSALQRKFRLSQVRKKYFKGFVVFMKYQKNI
ncbi:GNAT family N-acetyltransferase [Nostocales cyanobacterium LEGE 11386]|nr:GNAT family N-acetyltransferase [Nostocales cyanobacterium LEGE 11386]